MPVEIRRRLPQSGRIRIGQKGARGQPQRLETFRLTSQDQGLLQAASALWGGTVQAWKDRDNEYELITAVNELPVFVTPEPLETWYELWSAGGCQRRCDGQSCTVPDGTGGLQQQECVCDPSRRECQLKTRVNLMLADLPGIGVWRLDTGSYYTAAEMPGQVEILQRAAAQGRYPEAFLAIETRRLVTRDEHGKPITRIFPVATVRVRMSLRELLTGGARTLPAGVDPETGEVLDALPPGAPESQGDRAANTGQGNGRPAADTARAASTDVVTKARNAYFAELGKRMPSLKSKEDLRRCFEAVLLGLETPLQDGQRDDWTDYEWDDLRERLVACDARKDALAAKAMLGRVCAEAQVPAAAAEEPAVEAEYESESAEDTPRLLADPFQDDAEAAPPSALVTGQ